MKKFDLHYSKQAEKYLIRLPRSHAESILKRLEYIAINPLKLDNNIVKLAGTISSYRLRTGNIRIIYQIDMKEKIIYIVKIAPRGSIYTA